MELDFGRSREERDGARFVRMTSSSLRCGVVWCGVEASLSKKEGVDVDDPYDAQ